MVLGAPVAAQPRQAGRASREPWRELGIVVLAMIGYFALRLVVEGNRSTAVRNAERLLDLEAWLGIDIERDMQRWVLDHDVIRASLSAGYVWLHWPLLIAAMAFLALRRPAVLARLRNAMIASGALGLVLFALVPMAPPRFLPGFVGTVSDDARRHYLPYSLDWTNEVAAFPSYHVGWTLIACLAVAGVLESGRARLVVMAPAAIVAVAVVGTGNHYVLDSFSGAVFAVGAWSLAGRWGSGVRPIVHRDTRDRAGIIVDADDGGGVHARDGTVRRVASRPVELARDDHGVAPQPADIGDDRSVRHEQWCP